jgi:hypothetical protein
MPIDDAYSKTPASFVSNYVSNESSAHSIANHSDNQNIQDANVSPDNNLGRLTNTQINGMRTPTSTTCISATDTTDAMTTTGPQRTSAHMPTKPPVATLNLPNNSVTASNTGYTPEQLTTARKQFETLQAKPFQLPACYDWFNTHARFIFSGAIRKESFDTQHLKALEKFTNSLSNAALYAFGFLEGGARLRGIAHAVSEEDYASCTVLEHLLKIGKEPNYILGDLLGLQVLHEDDLLSLLTFDAPHDLRRFARIYTLAKHLYAAVDPQDEYIRITDIYHPKNVISHLRNKGDLSLLTAAAFHDFERYVPGIRMEKLPCVKLDETIRKQAMHPLNSAKLARHLLQLAPLTPAEQQTVFDLIRNHDAGPNGLRLEGYQYAPVLTGALRDKLCDLTNADTAAFFDFSPMQDPTVEIFVKHRITAVFDKVLPTLLPPGTTLSEKSKTQMANLALTQQATCLKPLCLREAITPEEAQLITDLTPLNDAMEHELDKLVARITKHAKRISPDMLGTVAVLHAQRPRTEVDALIHTALKKYDRMNSNLKSLKNITQVVIATQQLSKAVYQKKPSSPS